MSQLLLTPGVWTLVQVVFFCENDGKTFAKFRATAKLSSGLDVHDENTYQILFECYLTVFYYYLGHEILIGSAICICQNSQNSNKCFSADILAHEHLH